MQIIGISWIVPSLYRIWAKVLSRIFWYQIISIISFYTRTNFVLIFCYLSWIKSLRSIYLSQFSGHLFVRTRSTTTYRRLSIKHINWSIWICCLYICYSPLNIIWPFISPWCHFFVIAWLIYSVGLLNTSLNISRIRGHILLRLINITFFWSDHGCCTNIIVVVYIKIYTSSNLVHAHSCSTRSHFLIFCKLLFNYFIL